MTPSKFFDGAEVGRTPADTTRGSVNVKGPNGVHKTKASGIRIFLPDIPDVGIIRQRYPIFPVHGEGMFVLCVYVYLVKCQRGGVSSTFSKSLLAHGGSRGKALHQVQKTPIDMGCTKHFIICCHP